jgi:hypothetical protein
MKNQRSGHLVLESVRAALSHCHLPTHPNPFALSLYFDRLRMIGNSFEQNTNLTPFGLSLPFDKLRMIGTSNRQNTNPAPFGLSLSKPYLPLRGTSTGSVRTGWVELNSLKNDAN